MAKLNYYIAQRRQISARLAIANCVAGGSIVFICLVCGSCVVATWPSIPAALFAFVFFLFVQIGRKTLRN